MPFGPYDLHSEVYDRFCEEQIAVIVLLASDEECLHKTGCNLRALYLKEGFQELYLPIPDFGVLTRDDLEQTVQQTIDYAQAGHHIVIHSSAVQHLPCRCAVSIAPVTAIAHRQYSRQCWHGVSASRDFQHFDRTRA